jgi:hypothetical protein
MSPPRNAVRKSEFVRQESASESQQMYPISPGFNKMPNSGAQEIDVFTQLMQERDEILAEIVPLPPAEERHASIAVFDGWADGVLSDEYLATYLKKFHADLSKCTICSENYAHHKSRRDERLR